MNIPLVIDETDPKWDLLGNIMDIVSSRRVKQVMAKLGIKPVNKAGMVLKVSIYRYVFLIGCLLYRERANKTRRA